VDESFDEYVRTRGEALLRFGYVVCGDWYLAEDLVQEVLAKVCRRWSRFARIERPDAYLRTAVVRQFLSWRRRPVSRELPLTAVPEPAGGELDVPTRHALRDEAWRLLATLPRRQRVVLVLRYYEDLSDDRIAEVMGCRPTTVRVHAHRGVTTLRERLRVPAPDPAVAVRRSR
jgi:RNA polymerase sigma-70 factor (sigma-E family)